LLLSSWREYTELRMKPFLYFFDFLEERFDFPSSYLSNEAMLDARNIWSLGNTFSTCFLLLRELF
jgi:hypothetical protein